MGGPRRAARGSQSAWPTSVWEISGARRLYSRLPTTDFSTHILAGRAANLAVPPLDGVGWSDLGRPGRVLAALAHAGTTPRVG